MKACLEICPFEIVAIPPAAQAGVSEVFYGKSGTEQQKTEENPPGMEPSLDDKAGLYRRLHGVFRREDRHRRGCNGAADLPDQRRGICGRSGGISAKRYPEGGPELVL